MTIGWYVHHHGAGHVSRFLAASRVIDNLVALSSAVRPSSIDSSQWIALPFDAPAEPGSDPGAGGALHWAPIGHAGLRARMARIAAWIDDTIPRAFVVDVSVEVALLARLHGIPTVWIAQRGDRGDRPHQLAYAVCDAIVAPWSAAVPGSESSTLPRDRTHFVGALSRFDDRPRQARAARGTALVLLGDGGHTVTADQIAAAAAGTPEWVWTVAGLPEGDIPGVVNHGPVGDVWPLLNDADVVIGSAGTNVVSETAAARRPLVVIPQVRPFDEQRSHAAALVRAGLADSYATWPTAEQWPSILRRASLRNPDRWDQLHDGSAVQRLHDVICGVACASA